MAGNQTPLPPSLHCIGIIIIMVFTTIIIRELSSIYANIFSSRYKLNEYLPIHCWLQECARMKVERFRDMVRIIHKRQETVIAGKWESRRGIQVEEGEKEIGNTVEQNREGREDRISKEIVDTEIQPQKMFRSFYCAVQFSSQKDQKIHQETCQEKH